MNLSQLQSALNSLADDVVPSSDALPWLNAGKDKMAQRAYAIFPDLANSTDTPVFEAKWHYCIALYAASKYKEQDSAINEAQNYMAQFQEMCDEFASRYSVPLIYRDDDFAQQFTGTQSQAPAGYYGNAYSAIGPDYQNDPNLNGSAPSQTYVITKDTFMPIKGQLKVYLTPSASGVTSLLPDFYVTDNGDGSFSINASIVIGTTDQITAVWNPVDEMMQPPYEWWGAE